MKIALDYDKTYSLDKEFWNKFSYMTIEAGHDLYLVTARSPTKDKLSNSQIIGLAYTDIIYCDGIAKRWHLHHHYDLDIDIWIDDKPDNIINNSTATKEVLEGWRASEEYKV